MAVDKRRAKNRPAPASTADTQPPRKARHEGSREAVESIVIALILAFLFRTFEGEAFEIPTGSMGPTLMGRHKELSCPECGLPYRAGASSEVDQNTGQVIPTMLVQRTTCPNCRFTARVGPGAPEETPSYKGDRLWVSKAPYTVADPKRWDVAVFKWPIQARENYIKRVVGLPGEQLRIHGGDLFVRSSDQEEFQIARKSHVKVTAIMQSVYDNDHRSSALDAWGWPHRWQPETQADSPVAFEILDQGRRFRADTADQQTAWLRYHHVVPSFEDWTDLQNDRPLNSMPRPQLVTDFTAYNTATPVPSAPGPAPEARALGLHWVPDLVLECEVEVHDRRGAVILELISAGRAHRCRLDLASGDATLSIDGEPDYTPRASTPFGSSSSHTLRFANVDQQLLVWVDGSPVEFDGDTGYSLPAGRLPQPADLAPAAAAAEAAHVTIGALRLSRDVYYIAFSSEDERSRNAEFTDFEDNHHLFPYITRQKLADFMSSPDQWDAFENLRTVEFQLGPHQYFAMGDNSPNSSDSRFWTGEHYFDRDLLIGKAFFIYWPRALVPAWHWEFSIAGREYRVPFFPNYHRIGFIH